MSDTAAFPEWVLVGGMIVAALLAAAAVLGRTVRGRAWAMLGALILTPVLLAAEIWDSPQIETEPIVARLTVAVDANIISIDANSSILFEKIHYLRRFGYKREYLSILIKNE